MSKHQRHVRRERNKTDRARRTRARFPSSPNSAFRIPKAAAAALATAAAIAAGTSAYASPVRFDNPAGPAHFSWAPEVSDFNDGRGLDLTLSAPDQPGSTGPGQGPSTLLQTIYPNFFQDPVDYETGGQTLLGYGDPVDVPTVAGFFVPGVAGGTPIPSGYPWADTNNAWLDPAFGFGEGYLPEGQPTYVGVRFDLGSGSQYGWVGVTRTGAEFDAFAWGYETEVGVPIVAGVPEPGTLALLAVGAAGVAGRRSRRQRHDN